MRIRTAVMEDLAAVRAVAEAAYAPYLPRMDRRPAPMDADFAAACRRGELIVATDGAGVRGFMISARDGVAWQIDNIALDPAAQGQGLGRQLIAWAEARASRAGCVRLTLYTNIAMREAMAVYTALGFAEVDRRRDEGFERVFYSRDVVCPPD